MERGPENASAGALVRRYRQAVGWSQRQLAERAGVSIGVVRDLEQHRTSGLHLKSAENLVRALGLDQYQASALARAARVRVADGSAAAPVGRRAGRAGLQVDILGPLSVWRGGAQAGVGPPYQRAVLAMLALNPGVLVRRETIIDMLWARNPPATAVNMVHKYVSGLRAVLDPARSPRDPGGFLVSARTGYRLQITVGQLDMLAFEQLVSDAQAEGRRGDLPGAYAAYEQALGLWRDEPLTDVDLLRGHPAVTGLSRRRAEVITEYAQAACSAGTYDRVLGHLHGLAAREPLNEAAHALLMTALAGTGQQAAALTVFEDLRRRLDKQLGVRPGPQLSAAHLRILRQDLPAAAAPAPPEPLDPGHRAVQGRRSPGRSAAGVSADFAVFYRDSLRVVIARGYLLYGDFRQAEEAAQEVFLAAYRQWHRLRPLTAGERRQHLMKTLISRHADHCRLQRLHAQAMTLALGSDGAVVKQVEKDALANDVIQALQKLPAQQRVIALMHWAEKIPVADIAQQMGIPVSAARTYLAQARQALINSPGARDLAAPLPGM